MTLPCSLSWDEILRGKSCEKGLRLKSMSVVTMWISFVIIHNSSDRYNEHGGEWSLPARRNFILNIHYKARAMSDLNFKYYTIYTHFITIHLSVWVSSGSFNLRFKNFALLLSIRLINDARNVFRRHSELLLRLKLKCWMFCVSVWKFLLLLRRELQPASYERQVVRWRKFRLLLNSFWELYCMSCFKNHCWYISSR